MRQKFEKNSLSIDKWLTYQKAKNCFVVYGIASLFLLGFQYVGLEWIYSKWLEGDLGIKISVPWRVLLFLTILSIFHLFLSKNLVKFVLRNQKETVKSTMSFLQMSIKEKHYTWFYIIKFVFAILIGKDSFYIWATPEQYMKMHSASAILARRYYYSFYKAPESIWKVLRNHGGNEYKDEVSNIHLKYGKRYVIGTSPNSAHDDFYGITNLSLHLISKDDSADIPDFSAFDAGDKFISLRISDEDSKYVEKYFDKVYLDVSRPDESKRQLNKITFRVHIQISEHSNSGSYATPHIDWMQTALTQLDALC